MDENKGNPNKNAFLNALDRYFGITARGSNVATEVKGGIITFLAMVYILTVNPIMLSLNGAVTLPFEALLTATALAAIISCLLMGLYARFPVALAPGMGVNVFLSQTVCLGLGLTFAQALLVVLFSGVLFFILSVTGTRAKIMEAFPVSLRCAFTAGIGLFIALIGLANAKIIVGGSPLALGDLAAPAVLLGILSIVVTLVLWFRKSWGAVLIGIIVTVIVGIIIGEVPFDDEIVSNPDFSLIGLLFEGFTDFPTDKLPAFIAAIIALAIMDMFDTTGTLLAVFTRANEQSDLDIEINNKALVVDSVATMAGAVVGTSTTTSFIESCTGIESGARTGLMPVVTALFFIIALFLSPIFRIVTNPCIAGALVLVGILMLTAIKDVDWKDAVSAATAFMTVAFIGFSGSITDGMAFGIITYVVGMIVTGKFKEVSKIMIALAVVFIAYFALYYGYLL